MYFVFARVLDCETTQEEELHPFHLSTFELEIRSEGPAQAAATSQRELIEPSKDWFQFV